MMFRPIVPVVIAAVICLLMLICAIRTRGVVRMIVRILMIVSLFLTNLRFSSQNGVVEAQSSNLNIILAVDTTISMSALDYQGENERMDGVISDIEYIMKNVPGLYELITFDNNASVKSPLTKDLDSILCALKGNPIILYEYAKGSSVSLGVKTIERMARTAAEKDDNRKTVLLFFSDGENTTSEEQESFAPIAKYLDGGAVIGYGTETGGYMQEKSIKSVKRNEYILEDSSIAVSRIDEENLRSIAKELSLTYVHSVENGSLDDVINELSKMIEYTNGEATVGYNEHYVYPAMVLCVSLMMELFLARRERR